MKTTMVGLVFLLLGSSTVSPTEPGIASQGSGRPFEHCCNDRQPGHLPIFRFDGFASYTTAIAASGDAADIYYPTHGSPAIFALLGDRFPVVVVLQGGRTGQGLLLGVRRADRAARLHRHRARPHPCVPARSPRPAGGPHRGFRPERRIRARRRRGREPWIAGLWPRRWQQARRYGPLAGWRCRAQHHRRHLPPGPLHPRVREAAPTQGRGALRYELLQPAARPARRHAHRHICGAGRPHPGPERRSRGARASDGDVPELEAPKALIEIEGANHYGINDVNNPAGATPNPSPSLISQAEALDRIATWSALFLRAELWSDPIARFYVYKSGGSIDGTVTVTSER